MNCTSHSLRTLGLALALGALLTFPARSAPPAALAQAEESAALPQGGWLLLDKHAVRQLDARGRETASLPLRAKQLDVRPAPGGALIAVFDANQQRPLLLRAVDGQLQITHTFEPVAFNLEAQCLYRDAQQLDHLFLIAKDGLAEQWLLAGTPRLLRRLALPPNAERCRGDDGRGLLYVKEPGQGVWAYAADGEGVPQRRLIGQKMPRSTPAAQRKVLPIVTARAQTEPVARSGDAADDAAIWVHPSDATRSRILGTNKKQGLLNYDLTGRQLQLIEAGRLNNVDLRQNIDYAGQRVDLALATQRDENALAVFEIDATGTLRDAGRIATGLNEIYGTCLYQPPQGGLEVFANDKDGRFEHYRVVRREGNYTGELLRRFRVASQPEGCVADDRNGRLFVGEEKWGIWSLPTAAERRTQPELVLATGQLLVADVEGLALYHGLHASYLIASSQGNNSYVVLDALPPHRVRGAFRIGINAEAGIDAVSETDGLEVSAANFGGAYERGLLVVQDGYKRLPDGPQNFKLVAWRDIARALKLDGTE